MILRTLLLLILSLTFTCCSNKPSDLRLSRVEGLLSESPKEAWDSLSAINYDLLSDADKHYYDFLSVKVADKAYLTHSSDSLILKVIDFEFKHQKNGRYPEALYYGGRVYSDLDDYPTSLHYFQDALKSLPSNSGNQELRCNILSQTGRLLTALSLYDEAIPYIHEALEINRHLQDTTNIIYGLQLLGGTYLRNSNYDLAEKYFKESIGFSVHQPSYHMAKSRMYLAAVKHKQGELDSALSYIRNTSEEVKPMVRNSVLGYASNIYLDAGILDTAYIYAKDLISNNDPTHKEIGYQVLLSPELRKYIEIDTLNQYISEYRTILESFYDENNMQLSINQQSLYNYQLHENQKAKAERLSNILKNWIVGFIFLAILLVLISLYFKNKSKNNIIELQQALANIEKLKLELVTSQLKQSSDIGQTIINQTEEIAPVITHNSPKSTEQELRECLKKELLTLYESASAQSSISPIILQSIAYQKIQEYIQEGKTIKESDVLWSEIEQIVLSSSPKFKINLNLLTLGNLTTIDLHTALLIKCGIKPSKMTTLLGRSNGAIVSRRETLCMKILDEKKGAKVIDAIIRSL